MAPTYIANAVAVLFIGAQFIGLDIPYTSEEVEVAVTVLLTVGVQLFTMARQWWTGRATLMGTRATAS